jgi:hypothetical protein
MKLRKLTTILTVFMILLGNIAIAISIMGFNYARSSFFLLNRKLVENNFEIIRQDIHDDYTIELFLGDTIVAMDLCKYMLFLLLILMALAILGTVFVWIKGEKK